MFYVNLFSQQAILSNTCWLSGGPLFFLFIAVKNKSERKIFIYYPVQILVISENIPAVVVVQFDGE